MKYPFTKKIRRITPALFGVLLLYVSTAVSGQAYGRDIWQKTDEVLKSLDLKPGDFIADIGAGDGYFTRHFARAVHPGGQALGLEVVSSNVESMRRDAESLGSAGQGNVPPHNCCIS